MGDFGFSLSKPDKPKSSGRSPIWNLDEFDSFEIASATPKLCRSLLELCRVLSLVDQALLKRFDGNNVNGHVNIKPESKMTSGHAS